MRSGDGAVEPRASLPVRAATAASTSRATIRPRGPDGTTPVRSTPASPASRRARGVATAPVGSLAGPKLRAGVRTSRKGSSIMGRAGDAAACGGAASKTAALDKAGTGAETSPLTVLTGAVDATPAPPRMATTAPTGATSPAATRICSSTPADVAGTSMDTLSVSISKRLSPGLTTSPTDLNQVVILPSATVSPSCGIRISMRAAPFRRRRTDDGKPIDHGGKMARLLSVIPRLPSVVRLPVHRYVLGFEELHHPLMGALPADAALLGAAERRGRIGHQPAVEPDHAVIEPFGYPHAAAKVLSVEIRDETVFCVVRPPDHFVLGLECLDRRHRSENLLVQHGGAVWDAGKDRRRIEIALALRRLAAGEHFGASLHRVLDQRFHLVAALCVDKRAERDAILQTVAHFERGHLLGELAGELVMDLFLHVKPVCGRAGLAHIAHLGNHCAFDGGIDIGVLEDDKRRIAAELHGGRHHIVGSFVQELAANFGRPRE